MARQAGRSRRSPTSTCARPPSAPSTHRLRSEVIADLKAANLRPLVPAVDFSIVFVGINEKVPQVDRAKLQRMLDLGLPVAVFVGPGAAAA